MATFESTLKPKLIYVFRINDEAHRGTLKIGEATAELKEGYFTPNSTLLNDCANRRIREYTKTASIQYELLYTEATTYDGKTGACSFNDKEVHKVLERSGIQKKDFGYDNQGSEWFVTKLETVKAAIAAVKAGRQSLTSDQISTEPDPIILRPEQRRAVDMTKARFRKGNQMLWNAKMRFGKTTASMQLILEQEYKRTLILTHRPVVDKGWYDDFKKIFYRHPEFTYGSHKIGESFDSIRELAHKGRNFIYFASMQDLRGSTIAGGKFDKNSELFSTPWDLLIIDEAHEGTQTELGLNVIRELTKKDTKVLRLSGTPFNLLDDYEEDEIFTWDYVMEQREKADWDLTHMGDPNPYEMLPAISIYTYDLGALMADYSDEERAFNFREFFRTREDDSFIHEQDVDRFLDLLCKDDKLSLYPFSNDEFRKLFRHTLWVVPGVRAARALSKKLSHHPVFGTFSIVNVAGQGDEDEENEDALDMVNAAIGPDPDETRTITLSCGRLTTGVSVKPWTGVLMLAGSYSTSAASYMQTIFRVQTPFTCHGRMKTNCYAFDFAPDRTLRVLAETAKVSAKAGKTTDNDRRILGDFLNFCPIIGVEGSQMRAYDVNAMMGQLKKAQIERVVQCGFEDGALYNDELLKLTEVELKDFADLKATIGKTKAMGHTGDIDINNQGFTNEEYEEKEKLEKKPKAKLTEEERQRLEELKARHTQRKEAISILRGISIRMPLLIYGAELQNEDEDITLENFASLIDDASWEEFMPKGVTKDLFQNFARYYDADIFREAGRRIRSIARSADKLLIEERIERIASIFNTFRNPDKETVLTPWRVVNMHMSDTLGGFCFYDPDFRHVESLPRFVDQGQVTQQVFTPQSRILEINSKSGLYPLYVAYNIYRQRVEQERQKYGEVGHGFARRLWDDTIEQNIFVICKTPMARSITRRTLLGFRESPCNLVAIDNLVEKIKVNPEGLIAQINCGQIFPNFKDMKFNAIVGNPPYQEMQTTEKTKSTQAALAGAIYPLFIDIAAKLTPDFISMITPSRWMTKAGRGVSDEWVEEKINGNHFLSINDYINATDCFPQVEIKGGVNYFLYSPSYSGCCKYKLHKNGYIKETNDYLNALGAGIIMRDSLASSILSKIKIIEGDYFGEKSFASAVASGTLFCDCAKGILNTSWKGYVMQEDSTHNIKYYLNKLMVKQGYAWIKYDDMIKAYDTLPLHKVYIPKAGGSGNDPIVLGVPFYGEPNSICSQTYICIGYDPKRHNWTKDECMNVIAYLKSRFLRYLVSIKKRTQDAFSQVYEFVPLQDFTANSDIDWSKPVADIDRQLYAKYHLTQEEQDYIESMIKPMGEPETDNPKKKTEPTSTINYNITVQGNYIENQIINQQK